LGGSLVAGVGNGGGRTGLIGQPPIPEVTTTAVFAGLPGGSRFTRWYIQRCWLLRLLVECYGGHFHGERLVPATQGFLAMATLTGPTSLCVIEFSVSLPQGFNLFDSFDTFDYLLIFREAGRIFSKMALYSKLPVYKATYDLLLAIFRFLRKILVRSINIQWVKV
jgi:hypothetical protein